jgi:hypothetical protein
MRAPVQLRLRTPIGPLAVLVAAACAATLNFGSIAAAADEGPGWQLYARTYPTNLLPAQAPGETSGVIAVDVFNIGAAAATSESLNAKGQRVFHPITVTDTLPPGIKAKDAGETLRLSEAGDNFGIQPKIGHKLWDCTGNGPGPPPGVLGAAVVTCTNDPMGLPQFAGGGGLPTMGNGVNEGKGPNLQPELAIAVEASSEAAGLTNRVTIAGGGALGSASTENQITVSATHAPFGFAGWDVWSSNADGTPDTQAGSHPYETTFVFDLATALTSRKGEQPPAGYIPDTDVRNIEARLPPGFVADPLAVPQCTRLQLANERCPQASQVGIDEAYPFIDQAISPVFNMVPPPGVAAEFALNQEGIFAFFDSGVRSGGDYGITTRVNNISQRVVRKNILTLWGVPGEASHDPWRTHREGGCTQAEIEHSGTEWERPNYCAEPQSPVRKPLLTLPTACREPQPFLIRVLSGWQDPNARAELSVLSHNSSGEPVGFTGCEDLAFEPLITTAADTAKADTPTGLTVEVKPSVGGLEEPKLLGASDIQDTTVTLPRGFVINPGQSAGLQACGAAEDGLTTQAEKEGGEENDGRPHCPNASKIGTVQIKSPLVEAAAEKEFQGDIYVLRSNPPELKLLLAASADGVNIKLVGVVHLDERTGQLEAKFEGTPQLPFTLFRLSFSGGPQAALDTPPQCGTYTTTADFKPWSNPFISEFETNASFAISEGPGGGPCPPDPLPFAPTMIAGATNAQAGGFTNLSLLLQRGDGQKRIERLRFKTPPGLLAMISQVPPCPEPQAAEGACPATSHIGHTVIAAGPGPYPLVIPQPGQPDAPIYLTGPYKGAPFGLSIVVPVLAGPFNLGTIVTRAAIEVDPTTAQLTITTDPLPQAVTGVPTDLRWIDAVVDRPSFMFNPTNCSPMSFSGAAWGAPPAGLGGVGASAPIATQFQVGSCPELKFTPKLTAVTTAQVAKASGVSLKLKVTRPSGPSSNQTNFSSVKVDLPKQLPSRLTAVQNACPAAQFEANPANCPPQAVVGHVRVLTPVLPVALEGPVYFISHGGAAFPSLVFVLQGDNVVIDIVSDTFISKAGVTSSTLKILPDAPFSLFELTLPQGRNSALAANVNLCSFTRSVLSTKRTTVGTGKRKHVVTRRVTQKLAGSLLMPTEFVGQNGVGIKQSTKISVMGCPKAGRNAHGRKPTLRKGRGARNEKQRLEPARKIRRSRTR